MRGMMKNAQCEPWQPINHGKVGQGGGKKTTQLKLLTDVQLSNRTVGCFYPNKQEEADEESLSESWWVLIMRTCL